jgi:hypothetical protein
MVGSINYIAGMTRPDLSYTAGQLSRVLFRPKTHHMKVAAHAICFLINTASHGLNYDGNKGIDLRAFSDSDHQACKSSKSITGVLCSFAGGPIHWQSKRQDRVTNSSCESEAQALITCVQSIEFIRDILEELDCQQLCPTQVFCDNSSTVKLACDPVSHQRTKQMRKAMHYVRDCKERRIILPVQISTTEQQADILTKNQPRSVFEHNKKLINMI